MRIRVDPTVCQGHALCEAVASDLFTLDDEGYSNVDETEVPAGLEELARRAMQTCPERAITILE
jgi:ferredoxin